MSPPRQLSMLLRLLFLVPVVLGDSVAAPAFSATAETATEIMVATVRSVDPQTTTLDLITGCGHCLHTVRMTVSSETRIRLERKRAAIAFSDLKPGLVVRAEFQRVRDQNLATSIEVKAKEGRP